MKVFRWIWISLVSLVVSVPSWGMSVRGDVGSGSGVVDTTTIHKILLQHSALVDSVIDLGKTFLNKPYKYKGPSDWPMDCSGFLAYIFSRYGYKLPHSSVSMGNLTTPIDFSEIQKGDLIFFKGRNEASNAIGHVSLVIKTDSSSVKMMHSCKRGILIEDYDNNAYYKKRFLKAGRLPFLLIDTAGSDTAIPLTQIITPPQKDTISIVGVGDMMLGTNYPSSAHLPPNDGKNLLPEHIKQIISSADIAFGNLEGTLLTEKGTPKHCKNPSTCYAFKMPNHYVYHFKSAGFDLLSIANNHVGDFGEKGRENTVRMLEKAGISYAGLKTHPFTILEKEGVTYGFTAFAPNEGTNNINNIPEAVKIVRHLDSLCDIVIVSMHVGAEGAKYTHITRKNEIFLKENRGNPYLFARAVIDAGADVVFGHGPHVTRAIDLYKNKFIAYSMGNFATYGRFNLSGVAGTAPIVSLVVDRKGNFIQGKIHATKQVGEGGPRLDPSKSVIQQIIKLTKSDVPKSPLTISTNGLIKKK